MLTPPTALYTLSLHDALPILPDLIDGQMKSPGEQVVHHRVEVLFRGAGGRRGRERTAFDRRLKRCRSRQDRKSTRLNSSHRCISYAVFCLKKKNTSSSHASRM